MIDYDELGLRKDIRRDILILVKGVLKNIKNYKDIEWDYGKHKIYHRYLTESKYVRIEQMIYKSKEKYQILVLLVYVSGSNCHYDLMYKDFPSLETAKDAINQGMEKIYNTKIEKDDIEEIKSGYKITIVDRPDTSRSGYISLFAPPVGSIEYKKDIPAKPLYGCGPLSAFDTLEHTRVFINFMNRPELNLQIWKCRYKPSKTDILYCKTNKKDEPRYFRFEYPKGTVFAREITLTERIE